MLEMVDLKSDEMLAINSYVLRIVLDCAPSSRKITISGHRVDNWNSSTYVYEVSKNSYNYSKLDTKTHTHVYTEPM